MAARTIFAPAKINLSLHITGRSDEHSGHRHFLQSLIVFAQHPDACDRLDIVFTAGKNNTAMVLDVSGPFAAPLLAVTAPQDNLIQRTFSIIQNHVPADWNVHVTLHKNLPVAAGLGGGTADATAFCRAYLDYIKAPMTPELLSELTLHIGADFPACWAQKPIFVEGFGERIQPLAPSFPTLPLVLINPMMACPTGQVFAARTGEFSAPISEPPAAQNIVQAFDYLVGCRNDLEDAAIKICPVVQDVLSALRADPNIKLVRMSGSGATCWGLCESIGAATKAAEDLKSKYPDWWIVATETA